MQLQQLRYLIAAADYGSLRTAAQKLYVSQSSLSVTIKDLEQEMGVT
ncbi:MAG: LysR family transcriptional regulator, partial [Eggerthellaceae bacterium]|nr:LysR family transcriptional regulator [Eggerthellaceae bacterium]